jgi:hypothetical protein
MSTLTVTESAIIDFERQKEAVMARAKNFNAAEAGAHASGRVDTSLTADAVEALTAPVRVEITFKDPIHTRQQIEALQSALVEALVVTQDHGRGINRQRMDLRHILKTAAEVLVYMNGRTPTGRKPIRPRNSNS